MNKDVLAQVFAAFAQEGQNVETMPKDDPLRIAGERMGNMFTEGVLLLRGFPNQAIQDLAMMVWDIVGNRVVLTALGPAVPSLSLAAIKMRDTGETKGIIFVPHNWPTMVREDPVYQLGALVFVGSQAVDYYNERLTTPKEAEAAKKRARAHEAEYLLAIRGISPEIPFNEWQRSVLYEYPQGLKTPSIVPLLYKSKPFVKPSGSELS